MSALDTPAGSGRSGDMAKVSRFCPHWSWWIRSGERHQLGIDILAVFSPESLDTGNPDVRAGLQRIRENLDRGSPVVDSLRQSGMRLPLEAWCLLEAGEHSGKLGEALQEVGRHLEDSLERRRELLGQLWYPALVALSGSGVLGIILLWVVPQLRGTSEAMGLGGELPWLTENIGNLFGGLFAFFACSGIFITLCLLLFHRNRRRSEKWARTGVFLIHRIPLVGEALRSSREARILKQLATLLRGGTTLPRALEMCAEASPDLWEHGCLLGLRQNLLLGAAFSEALHSCPVFGPGSVSLLLAGQEAGRLEDYMSRVARDLERRARWKMRQTTRLMEPLFLIGMSAAVASLILAYILPMVSLLEQTGGNF